MMMMFMNMQEIFQVILIYIYNYNYKSAYFLSMTRTATLGPTFNTCRCISYIVLVLIIRICLLQPCGCIISNALLSPWKCSTVTCKYCKPQILAICLIWAVHQILHIYQIKQTQTYLRHIYIYILLYYYLWVQTIRILFQ